MNSMLKQVKRMKKQLMSIHGKDSKDTYMVFIENGKASCRYIGTKVNGALIKVQGKTDFEITEDEFNKWEAEREAKGIADGDVVFIDDIEEWED